jgi:hypothetical protein
MSQTERQREYQKTYRQSPQYKAYRARVNNTIIGYLRQTFNAISNRCRKRQTYLAKGIQNKFESVDDLYDYVMNVLVIDPRGLTCHRTDNDGHYEPGNIEFLTTEEHSKLHAEMRGAVI